MARFAAIHSVTNPSLYLILPRVMPDGMPDGGQSTSSLPHVPLQVKPQRDVGSRLSQTFPPHRPSPDIRLQIHPQLAPLVACSYIASPTGFAHHQQPICLEDAVLRSSHRTHWLTSHCREAETPARNPPAACDGGLFLDRDFGFDFLFSSLGGLRLEIHCNLAEDIISTCNRYLDLFLPI